MPSIVTRGAMSARGFGFAGVTTYLTGYTWNPSDKGSGVTLSNTNHTMASSSGTSVRGTVSKTSGKWYTEVLPTVLGSSDTAVGLADAQSSLAVIIGVDNRGWGYRQGGSVVDANNVIATYSSYTISDKIGIAFDLDNGKLFFALNGIWQGSSNPATNTGGVPIPTSFSYFIAAGANSAGSYTIPATLTYAPPVGFGAL